MQAHLAIAEAAALFADRSRVSILLALAASGEGAALPAGELARAAGIGAATASAHLARLERAGLLVAIRQGRHRYFRLVRADLVEHLEAIGSLATSSPPPPSQPSHVPPELRFARWCYGHLAGTLGVGITRALCARGVLTALEDGCAVTAEGRQWAAHVGLALPDRGGATAVRLCAVDWSERQPHLAGALGRALGRRLVESRCLLPIRASRGLRLTERGRRWLQDELGLSWPSGA
jgi:DNA-binding transcriptional ArsR family regulator